MLVRLAVCVLIDLFVFMFVLFTSGCFVVCACVFACRVYVCLIACVCMSACLYVYLFVRMCICMFARVYGCVLV